MIESIHHVQLAMPAGGEAAGVDFYSDVLGLQQVEKPQKLRGRGGAWFEKGALRIHLGVEADFRPAKKAHVALSSANLDRLAERLDDAGFDVIWDDNIPSVRRFYSFDPFGNRLEFMESQD